jgi:hypothetical protein
MILPSKNIPTDRALLSVSAWLYAELTYPKSISRLWDDLRRKWSQRPLAYQWFLLALDLLFTIDLIELGSHGLLRRRGR